jgi:nitrite reductase (NO-forming)
LDIKVDLPAGQTTNVTIDAPAGTYTFYCSIPGHRQAGMEGTLTVKEGVSPPAQPSPAAGGPPESGGEAAQPITVDLVDVAFNPPDITVKANTPTTITLTNNGASEHTFTVGDLCIDEKLAPAQTKEITINAAAGSYEITCSIPGHAAAGMVGTLTIE